MKLVRLYILLLLSFVLYSCGGKSDGFAPSKDLATALNPVIISPNVITIAVNNTIAFNATGGSGSYSYSIFSGSGSILSTTGNYTAPAFAGSAVVRVIDSQGRFADAIITIKSALQILPTNVTVVLNGTVTFSTNGGVSPFTYSVFSGTGSVNATSGLYTAPATTGSAVVRVTDSVGNTSDANVTATNTLTINPATPVYVVTNGSLIFSSTGGTGPYTFSCVSGTIDPALGDYIAPATTGSDTCTVTDSLLATSSATVTIYNALTLSPATITLAINGTQTFTATGGVGTRTFSLFSGVGSIDAVTGVYTAPANSGSAVIAVSDTIGNSLQANITIVSSLTITPRDIFIALSSTVNAYTATLGTAPYTFSVDSGGGAIVAGTGVYTASSTAGSGVVRLTDSVTTADTTNVYHITPVDIQSSWGYHFCALYSSALYSNYKVKCWGYNNNGQLGLGDTNARGDATNELGYGLPFVDLGTNKFAKKIALGWYHTCAILNDDTVKCWGYNLYGQLGYGNTANKGNATGQMGDNLATVSLGTGRTAKEIYAFGYRTCAILDDNTSKCWGRNNAGQLGQGNITNYGSGAGQMGDALPAISLGTALFATKFAGTENTTCTILNNSSLKCFGLGANAGPLKYYGELGLETNNKTWGDAPGEMGDFLPTVNLGLPGGDTVVGIAGGRTHYCALTSAGAVKCWGRNNQGQLGYDNTTNRGDAASTMGAFLANVNLGTTATSLAMMRESSCAKLTASTSKCWGRGANGQLLQGNINDLGDQAGEMAALAAMNLGIGRTVSKIAGGYVHACAILDNNRIKCWGATTCGTGTVSNGCLLNGTVTNTNLGAIPSDLGDGLPYVNH